MWCIVKKPMRARKAMAMALTMALIWMPAAPVTAQKDTDPVAVAAGKVGDSRENVVLSADDNTSSEGVAEEKTGTEKQQSTTAVDSAETGEGAVVSESEHDTATQAEEVFAEEQGSATEGDQEEGWPTWRKIAVGAGVATVAVAGAVFGFGGSSGDDGPRLPTPAEMVGGWHGHGTSNVDNRTYDGTYTLYEGGSHIYDIYLSTGEHKRGRGSWDLPAETRTLTLRNDTGSVYVGDFVEENFTTINMRTTDGRWSLTLTKQ